MIIKPSGRILYEPLAGSNTQTFLLPDVWKTEYAKLFSDFDSMRQKREVFF